MPRGFQRVAAAAERGASVWKLPPDPRTEPDSTPGASPILPLESPQLTYLHVAVGTVWVVSPVILELL